MMLTLVNTLIFSQNFQCSGDIVPSIIMDKPIDVCQASTHYPNKGQFRLRDFDGASNGGLYGITMLKFSASWCPYCQQAAAAFDVVEQWIADNNKQFHFVTHMEDLNQPYNCQQWQAIGTNDPTLILDGQVNGLNQNLHAGAQNNQVYPSFTIIDHKGKVLIKWVLSGGDWDGLTPCDDDGQSGITIPNNLENLLLAGNYIPLYNMINAAVARCQEEMGERCQWTWEKWTRCHSVMPGDANADSMVNVQDIVSIVNCVLDSSNCDICYADLNVDSVINVQDIVLTVDIILSGGNTN